MIKKTIVPISILLLGLMSIYSSCKKKEECSEKIIFYLDADSDGYGNTNSHTFACSQPNGYVANNLDSDDTNPSVNPAKPEIADNHIDENGDGKFDYNLFLDSDNDGFGLTPTLFHSPKFIVSIYDLPYGYSFNSDDCDDSNAAINPNATEIGNNTVDENCDGDIGVCSSDSECGGGEVCISGTCETATIYYFDADGDGFGETSNSITAGANAPSGYVLNNSDCNDSDSSVCPTCLEVENNGKDDNCDGQVDECSTNNSTECDCTDGVDNDGDGYVDCADSECSGISGC
jgi:hypothetical protein